jgi:hypothetical protein
MIHCQHCGTDNLDGSEFCDECGMRLSAASARASKYPPPLPPPPAFTTESVRPRPAQPFTPPAPPPVSPAPPVPTSAPSPAQDTTTPSGKSAPDALPAETDARDDLRAEPPVKSPEPATEPTLKPASKPPLDLTPEPLPPRHSGPSGEAPSELTRGNAFSGDATHVVRQVAATQVMHAVGRPADSGAVTGARLVIVRGGQVGKEFALSGTEAMIGRWDADRGIFPDIDLDADDPEAKVSRRHARVIIQRAGPGAGQGDRYFVEDLGSTNGTFVNRQYRLRPGQPHPLSDGDEIIVGKTFLKLVVS